MSEFEKEGDDEKKLNKLSVLIFLAVACLWGVSSIVIDFFISESSARGQFGDKFGSINSLFSGLAFAGLIYAILLQRIELKLQRRELELTRDELRGQRGEFEEQNKTLRRQRFENTFFQMLSIHHEIVNSMTRSKAGEEDRKGRQLLKILASEVELGIKRSYNISLSANDNLQIINTAYKQEYNYYQSLLGHYFRNLYRLIKFIDESDVEDKEFYTDIVRAQLSNQELQLLFWNCLSDWGENFRPFISKYALFDNLPLEIIYAGQKNYILYPPEAYGGKYPI